MSESDHAIRAAVAAVTDRPEGECLVLLKLRHGNDLSRECVKIAHHLGWTCCKLDWRNLFACGLIKRQGDRGFIVLTSNGLHWSIRIAAAMARAAGLHFMLPHTSDRLSLHVRCTCGWTASLSKNQGHFITGQFATYGVHLDAVAKGIWKQPRSVEEIVGEVMAGQAAQAQLEHA